MGPPQGSLFKLEISFSADGRHTRVGRNAKLRPVNLITQRPERRQVGRLVTDTISTITSSIIRIKKRLLCFQSITLLFL